MKKRILSALLALVMVLALLPATALTAFAAEPSTGADQNPTTSVNVTYQAGIAPDGRQPGKWYWSETVSGATVYHAVTSGIVGNTGNSGTWYSADANPTTGIISSANGTLKTTSFTLLESYSFSGMTADLTTLIVDVNGYALTLPANINKLGSLTIYNKLNQGGSGSVSGITKTTRNSTATPVSGLTLNVTGANVGPVTLQNGVTNTVNLHQGATVSGLTMDGTNTNGTTTSYAAQTVRTDGTSTITGAISITGTGSNVTLANVLGGASLAVNSTGGTIAVSGYSNIGVMTVKTNAATAISAAYPRIDVTGGVVDSIITNTDALTTASANVTVTGATVTNGITVKAGTVNINAGSTVGPVTVPTGELNITGGVTGTTVGNITINASGKTKFKVTNSNVRTGSITAATATNLTVDIPADKTNRFGTLDLGTYGGGGVKGGAFTNLADNNQKAAWFASTVRFAALKGGKYTYYGEKELAQAISDLGTTAATSGNIVLVGHTNAQQITLKNADKEAKIGYSKPTGFYLPGVLLGDKITSWTWSTSANQPYDPEGLFTTPATPTAVTLVGQENPVQLGATKLQKVWVESTSDAYTKGIRANLVGNVITLSGAVNTDGGYTVIPLTLETDLKKADGTAVTASVSVLYNHNAKTIIFDVSAAGTLAANSMILTQSSLSMDNGRNVYTLSGSGLGVPAGDLKTADTSTEVQVTVNKGGWTQPQKDALIAKMAGSNGVFTWNTSPAILQAINAAQLTINSNTTLQNWVTQAQNYIWRYGNGFAGNEASKGKGDGSTHQPHTTSAPTDAQRAAAATLTSEYGQVYLVPYLQVTVTDVNETTGYMALTLTPSYRMVVSATSGYDPTEYYIVQQGRSLGTLTGDMGKAEVEFKGLTGGFAGTTFMHQDGTYVYGSTSKKWTITHAGNNNGLGSMVINTTAPLIELKPEGNSTSPKSLYDSLQAAVDDTKFRADPAKLDVVEVKAGYGGSGAINMTGDARTITVNVVGNTIITSSASGDLVKVTGGGHEYTVQLLKSTATGGNVAITVQTVTNGSASASATRAKAGDTVTITTNPSNGYSTLGVSAVGSNNTSISVSGSGNSWSFKVPENVTSITVTPNFGVAGQASVSVSNVNNGSATVANGANVVTQGSTVTVYTVPQTGYRATGVSVRFSNGTTVNATNTGTNTWTFTVPAGATAVTITPSFTMDTGLPFTDVSGDNFYMQYVRFVYKHGMMEGFGNKYTFNGNGNVTRAQLVLILYRLSGEPAVTSYATFKDVPTNTWYSNAVAWASANKIVSGRPGNVFDPGTAVTRQEFATILYNYNKYRGLGTGTLSNLSQFTDRGYVQSYALEAMQWAVGNGIIGGTTNTTLSPNGTAIRYQAAAMLTRYCQSFLKMS